MKSYSNKIFNSLLALISIILFYHIYVNKTITQTINHLMETKAKLLEQNRVEIKQRFVKNGKVVCKRLKKENVFWDKTEENVYIFEFYNDDLHFSNFNNKKIKLDCDKMISKIESKTGIITDFANSMSLSKFYAITKEMLNNKEDFIIEHVIGDEYTIIGGKHNEKLLLLEEYIMNILTS
ncbi:hypothetical protein NUSPORA_01703 [Nucleospora cyclopteri]